MLMMRRVTTASTPLHSLGGRRPPVWCWAEAKFAEHVGHQDLDDGPAGFDVDAGPPGCDVA
jgi:hypothetical protein